MKRILISAFICLLAISASGQTKKSSDILFGFDKYNLTPVSIASLDSLINIIGVTNDFRIVLKGHTDNVDDDQYNLSLSEKRNNAVKDYLVSKGISSDKISCIPFGESSPVQNNTSEQNKYKNRRVEIYYTSDTDDPVYVKYNPPKVKKVVVKKYDCDTVLKLAQGTKVIIPDCTFYPYKISEIDFNFIEIYSVCDMLHKDISLQTTDGDCLTSGGMLFAKPVVNGQDVKSRKGMKIKYMIPATNNFLDKEMKLYVEQRTKKGELRWETIPVEVKFEGVGEKYYVFEADVMTGFNIDKPLMARCMDAGPKVKFHNYKNAKVLLTYEGENFLSQGVRIKNNKYSLVKINEQKNAVLTITAYDEKTAFMATGPLKGLKFNEKKNTYYVKKKFFKPIFPYPEDEKQMDDFLCKKFSGE